MSDTTATTTQASNDQTTAPVAAPAPAARLSDAEQEAAVEALLSGVVPEPEKAPATPPGGDAAGESTEANDDAGGETQQGEGEQETDDPGIDYAQEIPLANGEKLTLGALKDHYQESAQREVAMIERENAVMTQRQELEDMAQYLNLPPEVKQQIAQQQIEHLRAQHGQMLAAIPEWKDQAAFEKGRLAIFDLGKEYGVDLSRVSDAKVVKMLHDFGRLKAQIKGARAGLKQVKTSEPKAIQQQLNGKGTELSNAINRAKQTGNVADQTAAVDMLLRG